MEKNLLKSELDPVSAYFLTLSSSTIDSYKYRIALFCVFIFGQKEFAACNWKTLKYTDVLSFISHEREQNKAFNTINVTLAALKGVSEHAWKTGAISVDEFMKISKIKKLSGHKLPTGRALDTKEVETVKVDIPNNNISARDFAIFALGCGGGLRRIEIHRLSIEDIRPDGSLRVIGKFNKERHVYLKLFAKRALNRWLSLLNRDSGPMFVQVYPKKGFGTDRLTVLSIHRAIERIRKNVDVEHFTTHDLRRTFITHLLDNDADKFSVKRLVGHSSINTTEIYDRRDQKIDKETIKLLPY